LLWTDEEMPVPLWSALSDYDDRHYRALKDNRRMEVEREYRRLLYVAMTRAEDELYVCGWKSSKPVADGSWYELIRQKADTWPEAEGKKVLFSDQSVASKVIPITKTEHQLLSLPTWAEKQAPHESSPSKPLSPSRMETPAAIFSPVRDNWARERGILIHRLLQYLPGSDNGSKKKILERIMSRYAGEVPADEKEAITREVLKIIEHSDFAPVFSKDSVAEAPISGVITNIHGEKVVISGQIDRLAVLEDAVYIVDYKTGRDVPQHEQKVPQAYLKQMHAYRELISHIYPEKPIHCALLWTAEPKLMVLSHAILASLAA
jgi:ATP-dependent helicase/nuclease subunit A